MEHVVEASDDEAESLDLEFSTRVLDQLTTRDYTFELLVSLVDA